MNPKNATTIVMLTGAALIAVALLKGQPGSTYKKVWASGLAVTGLAFAADIVPELVGPFALLILLVVIEKNYNLLSGAAGIPSDKTSGKNPYQFNGSPYLTSPAQASARP